MSASGLKTPARSFPGSFPRSFLVALAALPSRRRQLKPGPSNSIPRLILGFTALLIALLPSVAFAHEIPADITVHAFLKPEPQRLRLLVRVPMKAMVDIEFPKRGPGYIDI